MKFSRRRITFQLTPLLDLLLIVIFAQFMEMQRTTDTQAEEIAQQGNVQQARADEAIQRVEQLLRKLRQADRESAAVDRLKTEFQKKEVELTESLRQSQEELQELGQILSRLFRVPKETIDRAMFARTAAEKTAVYREVQTMAGRRAAELVNHLRTWRELLKRCDLWEIHVGDDNAITMKAAGKQFRFRAETADDFSDQVFRRYKTGIAQPKALVIVLLSWSDAEFSSRQAAVDGLQTATDRMQADSDRRSRFEFAILGYTPRVEE